MFPNKKHPGPCARVRMPHSLLTTHVLIHLGCIVVSVVVGGGDVLPPAGALVLHIHVDGGVDTTQAVEQVVAGDLLEHRVGCAGGQLLAGLHGLHGLGGQQLQLAGGQGRDLLQVEVNLLPVDHHVGTGRGHKLHGRDALIIQVRCPVVDLHAGHDGVVGRLGVDGLADQVLQVLLCGGVTTTAAGGTRTATQEGQEKRM